MTQDEIIELAVKAGFFDWEVVQQFETFAKLVAEKAWAEGYKKGIEDERTSESNIGIAGFNMKVEAARENPYAIRARGQE